MKTAILKTLTLILILMASVGVAMAESKEVILIKSPQTCTTLEKECIRMGWITGLYSLNYWSEELHSEQPVL